MSLPLLPDSFITNRSAFPTTGGVATILAAVDAAIAAAHPVRLLPQSVRVDGDRLLVHDQRFAIPPRGLTVIGGGKAAGAMAYTLEALIGPERIRTGMVASPDGNQGPWRTDRINQIAAGHPVPTVGGREAARGILDLLRGTTPADLVICLLSGGGSAMLAYPPPPHARMRHLVSVTSRLLKSGASITEINIVRRHLSRSAGGKLARAAYPAPVLTLALRDVVDGPPEAIASGPTLPDPTTFADALAVLDRYGLRERITGGARAFLEQGLAGQRPENPKPGDPVFERCTFVEIGDTRAAVNGAVAHLRQSGLSDIQVLGYDLHGEAQEAAARIGAQIRAAAQAVPAAGRALVWGGEFTVTVGQAKGEGGRCQEFMAALIPEIAGLSGGVAMVGTDGVDFVPGIGGAVITGATAARISTLGLDLASALRDHAATSVHRFLGSIVQMRPTGTNVCDIGVAVIEPDHYWSAQSHG